MANLISQKTKPREEVAARGTGALTTGGDFPFFLSRMRDEFDRMLERFFGEWPGPKESFGNGWRWGLDVRDEADAVVVRAEAPGFEAGDFDLRVSDDRLVLRASRKTESKGKNGDSSEYREQEYHQSVMLPPGTDKDKVDAKYKNGLLTVTLPKTAEGKGKRVAVKNV